MRILSFDLGPKNSAWAITEDGKLIKCGTVANPISDLTDKGFNSQKLRFVQEVKKLTEEIGPNDLVLAERFQIRQFNPGAQIELVSVMLGLIAGLAPCAFYPVIAANWKNYFLRTYGENVAETILCDPDTNEQLFTEHESDAILLGLWFYEKQSENASSYLKPFFPIPKTCRRCYWRSHGCRGDDNICADFSEVNKLVKCVKCKHQNKCTMRIVKFGKAKKNIINKATSGCVDWKEL